MVITLPATTTHIGVHLSKEYEKEMAKNRKALLNILSSIRYLAKQGLALRRKDGSGNFDQLLMLLSEVEDGSNLSQWLKKKANRYTSLEVQNDTIKVMANHILRDVSSKLQSSSFLTVMMDETTDISNQEQVTIVMRRIDENFVASEEFLGLYTVSKIDASTLFTVIKDVMIRFNLPLSKLRGQCYDGCSTMSGSKSGVAKRIMDEEPRAVFTHCYCHSLNLAAGDSVKKSQLLKSALETDHMKLLS